MSRRPPQKHHHAAACLRLLREYRPGRGIQTDVEFYTALLLRGRPEPALGGGGLIPQGAAATVACPQATTGVRPWFAINTSRLARRRWATALRA